MRKIKLFVFILLAILTLNSVDVCAASFSKTISAGGTYDIVGAYSGDYYKYGKVNFSTLSSAGSVKYQISFIGYNERVYIIGTSNNLSTKNVVLLPRSGMNCPSGQGYCFGVGSDYSATKIVKGNECNGGMCAFYGIRIKNTGSKSLTVSGTYQLFLS